MPIRIAALYQFTPFSDHAALRDPLFALCEKEGIKGTLLLAHEGINGTIAGSDEGIEAVLGHIRTLPGCADLDVKEARAEKLPFHRMKVRLKSEIVTMGQPDIDPLEDVGAYVSPQEWNSLIADEDTVLIDTRNDYEVAIGTFQGAIDPHTKTFREFPAWFQAHKDRLTAEGRKPKVAMFCTGGIRCEKATAYVKAQGLDDVYHLKGGILAYLEQIPEEQSRWEGDCFVFDERVSVRHGLERGDYGLCRACRMPISPEDRHSPLYVEGVSCPFCYETRSEEQRRRYAERQKQTELAGARGIPHVGSTVPDAGDDADG
ncbi:rhodanese-related sulfurtransferase [Altericroceibacterium endophyticum]|uniref:tRNA uridine(34) hydroxylase n=1 Tax=Altericroceibacterium endophyticum TaxID=1808508 RepID=A0A6I4T540_9SPHN|nr:rhodanese-related sulfurtransferase [Altericroceibacterium endophyticum]MXO65030.1 rhodanese-related sulfurtransferase [Altericroceibacterium endophyticum]